MNMNKIMKAVASGALKAISMGAASMIAGELITDGLKKLDTINMVAETPTVEPEPIEVPVETDMSIDVEETIVD